jgi:hypothetical protein
MSHYKSFCPLAEFLCKIISDITCLYHLGQHSTDRIISIGQGKYNSDCCVLLSLAFSMLKLRQWKYCLSDKKIIETNRLTRRVEKLPFEK